MDESGWSVVKPFLAEDHLPYPILLGDGPTAQRFGIETLPDTFLVDRQARVAAAYRAGLVDKKDVEANIKRCSPSASVLPVESAVQAACSAVRTRAM
jgi:hypothetical protein